VYQYTKKRASGPKCPVTGKKIQGVSPALSPFQLETVEQPRCRSCCDSVALT